MKVNAAQFSTRTIRVPLTFEDGETHERQTEEFTINYRLTSSLRKQITEIEEQPDWNVVKSLALLITAIPEITDDAGNPIAISEENLESLGAANCEAIYIELFKDANPTKAPAISTVSPATSATEPAAQN